ncbi:hypothetical protein WA577_004853 [Blastocystis sp. JDR]
MGSVEELKQEKRSLERQIAALDKEIVALAANPTSRAALRAKCKQRAMLQQSVSQMDGVIANMQMVGTKQVLAKAQQTQINAIQAAGNAMQQANSAMKPEEVQQIVANLEKQQANYEMTNEMINNAMDSLYGVNDDEVDEEEDRVLFEVAGVRMKDLMNPATRQNPMQEQNLQQRLMQLDGNGVL